MIRTWTLYVNRSSAVANSGAGLILVSLEGWIMQYALRFWFKASNNASEYEVLVAGLTLAKHLEVKWIKAFSDSQLVVNQVKSEFKERELTVVKYLAMVEEVIVTLNCSTSNKYQGQKMLGSMHSLG